MTSQPSPADAFTGAPDSAGDFSGDRSAGRPALGPAAPVRATAGYSRFISSMKMVLPIIAVAIAVTLVIWPQMTDAGRHFTMSYTELSRTETDKPKMINARLTGIDARRRPYAVTANEILQVSPDGKTVTLQNPQADITMTDGSWVAVTSDIGVYRESTGVLGLRGNINLYHDSGFEFRTTSAHIDMNRAEAGGKERVFGQGPGGEIMSRGFYLPGSGNRVIFTGKSRLIAYPSRMNQG